jgi:hypothetical protein
MCTGALDEARWAPKHLTWAVDELLLSIKMGMQKPVAGRQETDAFVGDKNTLLQLAACFMVALCCATSACFGTCMLVGFSALGECDLAARKTVGCLDRSGCSVHVHAA